MLFEPRMHSWSIILVSNSSMTANVALPLMQEPQPPPSTAGAWLWGRTTNSILKEDEDDDSWEVRAFAEDTNSLTGGTWPPRSYACTFCRREFRSAQALGGHMNVHRRDRARLRQSSSPSEAVNSFPAPSAVISSTNYPPGTTLCLLYPVPSQTASLIPAVASPGVVPPTSLVTTSTPFISSSPSLLSTHPSFSNSSICIPSISMNNSVCPSNSSSPTLFPSGDSFRASSTEEKMPVSLSATKSSKSDSIMDFSLRLRKGDISRKRLQAATSRLCQVPFIKAGKSPDLRHLSYQPENVDGIDNLSVADLDLELRLGHSL